MIIEQYCLRDDDVLNPSPVIENWPDKLVIYKSKLRAKDVLEIIDLTMRQAEFKRFREKRYTDND